MKNFTIRRVYEVVAESGQHLGIVYPGAGFRPHRGVPKPFRYHLATLASMATPWDASEALIEKMVASAFNAADRWAEKEAERASEPSPEAERMAEARAS